MYVMAPPRRPVRGVFAEPVGSHPTKKALLMCARPYVFYISGRGGRIGSHAKRHARGSRGLTLHAPEGMAPPRRPVWGVFAEPVGSHPTKKALLICARPYVFYISGRGGRIRTDDLYVPNVALYQAKLHPDRFQ